MVAIVSGNGLGVSLSSLFTLGGYGPQGAATQGRNGEEVFVNAANGNLVLRDHDAVQAELGALPLDSLRVYNSQGTVDATDNWTNSFDLQRLTLTGTANTAGSTLTRTDADGAQAVYNYYADGGVYSTAAGGGAYESIVIKYDSGSATYTRVDGSTGAQEVYDANGRLVLIQDANYNPLTFTYGSNGSVASVADANNNTRTYYDYNANNQIAAIRTLSAGGATSTLVRYGYDTSNRLTSVSVDLSPTDNSVADGKVYTTTYTYVGATKHLNSVTQSDGSSLTFTYVSGDPTYRMQSVVDNLGNKTSFAYDTTNRKTSVTDANGQTTVYSYDASGQLLSVAVPTANGTSTTSYVYNANGDLTQVTDGANRTVTMTYDINGNQVSQVDAAGNTVTRTYDFGKQLLTETAYLAPAAGTTAASQPITTRYVYDANGWDELRFVISPEGRVTQYVYNDYNKRIATIQYAGAAYPVGTTAPTEAQMASWVSSQDLTKSVRTDVVYDVIGNPQQSTTYTKVDASGNGIADGTQSVTKYVYDQYGELLQAIKPGTGTINYTYDGLGRLLTTQDANGTATNVYNDAAGTVVATAANGLITTSTYDKAGRLVSVQQGTSATPSLGTTTYAYDADGNRLMTTDPDGNRTFALYDGAGRQIATVDATGFLTETVYNGAGQVIETIRYATAVNLASLVDSNGKALNPALSSIRPTGASYASWTLYDAAGRPVKQIDPMGDVVETRYDGDNRVTDVIAYANRVTPSAITATTLATSAAATPVADSVNDRRTRTVYDNDGNVTGTLDAKGYFTENTYDAAGRLVHTIRYATVSSATASTTSTMANLRPAADATHDIHAWNFYNAESERVASVDGEGYLTEYAYDADGHVVQTLRYATVALIAPQSITSTTTLAQLRPATSTRDQKSTAVYNALGQMTSSTTPQGATTQYTYDLVGNVLTMSVAATSTDIRTRTRRYDAQGHVTAELDGVGSAALAALGANPSATAVNAVWTTYATNYTYDADGVRASATDALGHTTYYFYDADGRATHTVNALGEVQEQTYNTLGQLITQTSYGTRISTSGLTGGMDTTALRTAIINAKNSALDSTVTITYQAQGLAGSRTDALGDTSTFTYNAFGQTTSDVQAIGGGLTVSHVTDYDRMGLVKDTQENGTDEQTSYTYDAFGDALTAVDPKGNTTTSQYDRLGRVLNTTKPLSIKTSSTWDAFGRTLTTTDGNGKVTTYVYDDVARTTKVTDPYGVVTTTTFNGVGQTISVQDGAGHVTTYAYDADGHLKDAVTDPGSGHLALDAHTDYDTLGRINDAIDANGNKVVYAYDNVNRALTRTEGANASPAMNIVTTYVFDAKGQVTSQKDPDGTLTAITYDLGGHVLTKTVDTASLNLKTVNTYDVRGNLLTQTDPAGTVTTYKYNALGRRTSMQVDSTLQLTTSYVYDADGNLTRRTDPDGAITLYAYDARGRLTYTLDPAGGLTGRTYDANDNVLTVTTYATPQSGVITLGAAGANGEAATTVGTVATSAQDVTTTTTYDFDNRQVAVETNKAGLDLKTQYAYDAAGNVTVMTDPAGSVTKTIYDAANRATAVLSATGVLTQTTYDNDGHVSKVTVSANPQTMTTATAGNGAVTNTLGSVTVSASDVTTQYTYDAAGRRTSSTLDPAGLQLTTLYAYDAAGNLTRVTDPAGKVTRYVYDGAGRQRYMLDPESHLTETVYDAAGRVTATILYGTAPTNIVTTTTSAGLVTTTFTVVGSSTLDRVTRYGYDAAGRRIFTVDAMGAVTESSFDADGLVLAQQRYTTPITLPATGSADGRTLAMTTTQIRSAIGTNVAGLTTRFAYDATGRQTYAVDAYGAVTGTTYDAAGHITLIRRYAKTLTPPAFGTAFTIVPTADPAHDQLTRYAYDAAGRLKYTVDPTGQVTANVFDADGRVIETHVYKTAIALPTDGSTMTVAAIEAKLPAASTQDRMTRYAYDVDGRQVYVVDPTAVVTETVYDAQGNVRATIVHANPIALPSTVGQTMSATDIKNAITTNSTADRVTRYVYDNAGRVTFTVDAVGQVVAKTYDKDGNLASTTAYSRAIDTSSLGNTLQPSDVTSKLTSGQTAYDRTTRYFYDGDNRLRFVVDALGFVTETRYAAINSTQTIRYFGLPTISSTATTSDVASACLTIASSTKDLKTTVTTDADGRTTDTTNAANVTSRDVYDALGRVTTHIDALGLPEATTTGYLYDAAGRVTSKTVAQGTAASQTTLSSYNALGELDYTVSPDGVALSTLDTAWAKAERSRLGMPTAVASLTTAQKNELTARYTTKFTYDLDARTLTTTTAYSSTTATSTTTSTSYDVLGNAVKVVDPLGNVGYAYFDQLGRVTMQVDPALRVVSTTYALGLSDKVATIRRYSAKAPANTTEATAPSMSNSSADVVTSYGYDLLGRVTSTTDASGSADAATESVVYKSADGNVFNKVVTNKVGGTTSFVFDRDGQELSETLPVTSLTTGTSLAVSNSYSYDAFGNRTQSVEAVGLPEQRTTTYQYDAMGRVIYRIGTAFQAVVGVNADNTLKLQANTPVDATKYDALGRVIMTLTGGSWDGTNATGGAKTLQYFDAAGNQIATITGDGAYVATLFTADGKTWQTDAYATPLTSLPATPGGTPPTPTVDAVNDRVHTYLYDNLDRLVETDLSGVLYWEMRTDSNNAVILDLASTSPQTIAQSKTVYDAAGNAVQQIDARGNSSYAYYDAVGRQVLTIDTGGFATSFDYGDVFDQATQQTRYSTQLSSSSYVGKPVTPALAASLRTSLDATTPASTSPNRVTAFTFDRAGRVKEQRVKNVAMDYVAADGTRSTRTADSVTQFDHDGLGNVLEERDQVALLSDGTTAVWNVTDDIYDKLGRLTNEKDPGYADFNGTTVRPTTDTVYDGLGNVVRTAVRGNDLTDANSRITNYRYDANGNLVQQTDANGNVTQYLFDVNSRVGYSISLGLQSGSGTFTGVLDSTTKFAGVRNADGGGQAPALTYVYDALGRQITQTDLSSGQVTNTRYDVFGEITGKGMGNDASTGRAAYQETSSYNVMGKVERSNVGDGVMKLYIYDRNGNTTRQIDSSTADLSAVSIISAATDTTLHHTYSVYDSRNNLITTTEPDISFQQDTVSSSAAYTQQLTNLLGAITVGDAAGGNYTQGTSNAGSYGYTQVGSENVSSPIPSTGAPQISNGFSAPATGATVAASAIAPAQFVIPPLKDDYTSATPTQALAQIQLPNSSSFFAGSPWVYRVWDPQTGAWAGPAVSAGSPVQVDHYGQYTTVNQQLEASNDGGASWSVLGTIDNRYWFSPTSSNLMQAGSSDAVANSATRGVYYIRVTYTALNNTILSGIPGGNVRVYTNFGTSAQAAIGYTTVNASTISVQGQGPFTVISDNSSGITSATLINGASSTPLPRAQVWTVTPTFLAFGGDVLNVNSNPSQTIHWRQLNSGTDWSQESSSGNAFDTSVLGRSATYEYVISSASGDFYGQFSLDGSGNISLPATTLNGNAAPPGFGVVTALPAYSPQVGLNLSSGIASTWAGVSSYTATVTYNGRASTATLPGNLVFDMTPLLGVVSRWTHLSAGYSYVVVANMADGHQQLVGQGYGSMTVGGNDFSATAPATNYVRPIAFLTLPPATSLTGTLMVGGVSINLGQPDSRINRTTDSSNNAVLAIDMTQFWQAGTGTVGVNYSADNAVFSGSFAVAANGQVTSNGITSQVRKPYVPITIPGATRLTSLQVGPNDSSLSDATARVSSSGGSTFVWDATDQVGLGARRFHYIAVDANGNTIGNGYGTITLATDGTLSYSFDTPLLKPSVMQFSPPANTTTFTLNIRPKGSGGAYTTYSYSGNGTVNFDIAAAGMRPGSGSADYEYTYVATYVDGHGVTQRASSGGGVLTVTANGQTTESNAPDHGPLTLYGPTGEHVPRMEIDVRVSGSGSAYTPYILYGDWNDSRKQMQYTWDVQGLQPTNGTTAQFDYTMRMQNSDGSAFLNEIGNPISIAGVMTLGGASTGVQIQQYVTELPKSAQVSRHQTFDAFGEISDEYDDATAQRAAADAALYGGTVDPSAVRTTFVYNTLGKLIQKIDPQTNVTLANGFRQRQRPVTSYGYDLQGRLTTTTDANGNTSRQNYVGAGTDHVSEQWAADGGRKETDYDIFGSARKLTDELNDVTLKTVDKMGNVVEVDQLGVARVQNDTGANKVNSTLTDLYVYDAFNRRIQHTNAANGIDKTFYDSLGRVVQTRTAAGRSTTYTYSFVPYGAQYAITGNGGVSVGGYQEVTHNADGTQTTDNINYFGVTTWHVDEGGHAYLYEYDIDGHLTHQSSNAGQNIYYSYYANGDLKEEKDLGTTVHTMSRYGYDNAGNRIWEQYSGVDGSGNAINILQSSTLVYDELNRLIRVQDAATDIRYQFDAVGNRRTVQAIYWDPTQGLRQQDNLWYTYDAVNRFTMTKGSLSGNATSANDTSATIVQGTQGVAITYDLRGERKTARDADGSLETYNYSVDGFLEDTLINGVLRARRRVDALGRTFEYLEYSTSNAVTKDQTSAYDADSRMLTSTDKVANSTTNYYYFTDTSNNQSTATQSGAGALAHVDTTPATGVGSSTIYTYQYWESARQTAIQTKATGASAPSWAQGMSQLTYDVNGYLVKAYDDAAGRTLTYTNSAHGLVLKRADTEAGRNEIDDFWYYANDHVVGDVSTSSDENTSRTSYAEQLAITAPAGKEATDSHKKNAPATASAANVDFDQNYQPINETYPSATGTTYTVHSGDTLKSIARNVWGDADMWYLIAQTNNLTGSETLVQGQILQIPNKVTNIHNNASTFKPYDPGQAIGDIDPTLASPPPPPAHHGGCGSIGTILMIVVAVVATIYTAGLAAEAMAAEATAAGAAGATAATAVGATAAGVAAAGTAAAAGLGATFTLGASVLAGTASLGGLGLAAAVVGGAVGSIAGQLVGDATGVTHGFSWKQVALSATGAGITAGAGWGVSSALSGSASAAGSGTVMAATAAKAGSMQAFEQGVLTAVSSTVTQEALRGEWSWREIAASAVGAVAGQAAGGAYADELASATGSTVVSRTLQGMAGGWAQSEVLASDPRYSKARMNSLFISSLGSAIGGAISDGSIGNAIGYTAGSGTSSLTGGNSAYGVSSEGLAPDSIQIDLSSVLPGPVNITAANEIGISVNTDQAWQGSVDDQGRPIPLSSTLPAQGDVQRVVVSASSNGKSGAANGGTFAFYGVPFVTRMPAMTSSGDWAKKAQPVYAFSPDLKTTYWYSNEQLYTIPKAFKTPSFSELANDPSNPFQPSRLTDSLIDFGLTTATGVLGMVTGGIAFGAMRTAGSGLLTSGAAAGFVGDLTTQIADNGVSLATQGSFGRTGLNGVELVASAGLAALPGLPNAVRGWASDLRGSGLPDWNIRLAGGSPGTFYGGLPPLFEFERIGNVAQDAVNPMSGPVVFKAPPSATPQQIAQFQAYVDGSNEALAAGYISPTGRVSTTGSLRVDASLSAAEERAAASDAGEPYLGHAGHVPDTTWTGRPDPYAWLDLDPAVNSSLGAQARWYPIGYKPTEFIFKP